MYTPTLLVAAVASSLVSATNIGARNNFCVDASVSNNQLWNGAALQEWKCASNWNQQWDIGNYQIRVDGTNKCVDVSNGNGYNTQIWDCTNGPNQRFSYRTDGRYEWNNSGRCITVPNGQDGNGVKLVLDKCNTGAANQVFSYGGAVGWGNTGAAPKTPVLATIPQTNGAAWVKSVFPTKRGISWAMDDRLYASLAAGNKISHLMHWEHGDVAGNRKLWLPQFWGDRKTNEWNKRKAEIQASGKVPPVVLSFNEPDLGSGDSQASAAMDPYWAAQLHKREIEDVFRPKGSKIIGPQIGSIWNTDWIDKFMGECQKTGCKFDGMGLHMYKSMDKGVDAAVKSTIEEVEKAYARFNLPLFITELGFTSAGGGADWQFIEYLQKIGKYLDNTDKVAIWALSACQKKNAGGWGNDMQADGTYFMNSNFAFFNADNSLTDLAHKYMWDSF